MIPYFQFTQIHLGPLTIQVWGLLVALGFLAGTQAAAWMARKRGLDSAVLWDLLGWIAVAALVCARLFHVFVYEPQYYLAHPFEIPAIWQGGLSSIGGFIGGSVAGLLLLRRRKLDVWTYADAALFGLPLGYAVGRIGCFLIHDHPGTATDFFLGVRFPDGIVRHDLGLYLSLDAWVLFALFLVLAKRKAAPGTYVTVFLVWYGVSRFFLDFLRASGGAIVDTRYFSLTPAQYASLLMVAGGIWSAHCMHRQNRKTDG
ncbi:prolipoprotein diacylglyceryl transferase [Candidatus Uhrbacteria bacterium]|nr:prolipoprotein diacylglyceryl transferase [Candidatus Uhrbacteria bacterium]